MLTILYIILALLGLSFLVFIHELGHYFVARKEGKISIFSAFISSEFASDLVIFTSFNLIENKAPATRGPLSIS